jgi:hypothetical protein
MTPMNVEGSRREAASRGSSVEKVATFVFGVTFLAVMLGVALLVPNPTESQLLTFRVVMAVAAGGAVVFLPGAFSLNIKPAIRATGALGVFALVYAVNPPKISTPPPSTTLSPNKYNLELKLTFVDSNDRAMLAPFEANIQAILNNEVRFSDYPSSKDSKLRSKLIKRGQGGIAVEFPDVTVGDILSVVVEQSGRTWRSDDMRVPESNLDMNAIQLSSKTNGGER